MQHIPIVPEGNCNRRIKGPPPQIPVKHCFSLFVASECIAGMSVTYWNWVYGSCEEYSETARNFERDYSSPPHWLTFDNWTGKGLLRVLKLFDWDESWHLGIFTQLLTIDTLIRVWHWQCCICHQQFWFTWHWYRSVCHVPTGEDERIPTVKNVGIPRGQHYRCWQVHSLHMSC